MSMRLHVYFFFTPSMHKTVLHVEKIVEEGVNKRD
jgi:hypothetical protein